MGLLGVPMDSVPDAKAAEPGEHALQVTFAEVKTSQRGKGDFISLSFSVTDDPDADNIYHVLMLPNGEDDEKKKRGKLRRIKSFCEAFDFDTSADIDNVDELVGLSGFALTEQEESEEYGLSARVAKWVNSKK